MRGSVAHGARLAVREFGRRAGLITISDEDARAQDWAKLLRCTEKVRNKSAPQAFQS